jgi:hypothetical protein
MRVFLASVLLFQLARGIHHMKRDAIVWVAAEGENLPLKITNQCPEVIYPAVLTQAGFGPDPSGFKLAPNTSKDLTVSVNWQGRVWGRTNCSFNADGSGPSPPGGFNSNGMACFTGDCGGVVECKTSV